MKLPPLHEKQLPMILRAAVFGFTTVYAEMRFCGYSADVTTGCLGARVRAGWLESFPLSRELTAFRLSTAAVTQLGFRKEIRVIIGGVQAALPRLAALWDCAHRRVEPLILSSGNLSEAGSTDFQFVRGESRPVALLMIDAGGNPVRVRYKANKLFTAVKADPHLGPVFQRGEFAIRLLTPSAGKAEALAKTFTAARLLGPIEIDVVEEMQKWLL